MPTGSELLSGEEKAKLCAACQETGARVRTERSDWSIWLCDKRTASVLIFYGEFDSGSERTLAAWIRHASRTEEVGSNTRFFSGARVSNT